MSKMHLNLSKLCIITRASMTEFKILKSNLELMPSKADAQLPIIFFYFGSLKDYLTSDLLSHYHTHCKRIFVLKVIML